MFRSVMKVEQGEHHLAWYLHASCGHRVRRLVMPYDQKPKTDEQAWCAECWKQVHQAPDLQSDRGALVLKALQDILEEGYPLVEKGSVEYQILINAWGLPQTGRSKEQSRFLHDESQALTWVEYWLRKLEKQGLVRSAVETRGWYKVKRWGLATRPASEQVPLLEGDG